MLTKSSTHKYLTTISSANCYIVSVTKLTYGFALLHNSKNNEMYSAQLSPWPNDKTIRGDALLFALQLRHSMNERVERPPVYTHACEYYVYIPSDSKINWWRYYCAGATSTFPTSAHIETMASVMRNVQRQAAKRIQQKSIGQLGCLQCEREATPGSRSIPMWLVRANWLKFDSGWQKDAVHLRIYLHAALNPIHASLCLFVCASGEFIQPPHSFINKLLAALY